MISLENLVHYMTETFRSQSSETIQQATQIIESQFQYPEFPTLLCQLISSSTLSNGNYIRLSIIFLKKFLQVNSQFLAENSLPLLLQLTKIVPPQLQSMIEIISDEIIKFDICNQIDPRESISQLLSSDSSVSGFLLLYSYFLTQKNCFHPSKLPIISALINAAFEIIGAVMQAENPLKDVYLHYFSESLAYYIFNCPSCPENFMPFLLFSIEILKANVTSPLFDLPSDYLEVIKNAIIHPNVVDLGIFIEAASSYFQHSPTFSGLTKFYQIMKIIIAPQNSEEASQIISDENLDQILQMFFFPVFTISEEEMMSFGTDAIQFIESIFASYDEEETPKSAASSCLYYGVKLYHNLPNIVFRQVLQLLSSSQINEWNILSIILYFSPVSQFFEEEVPEFAQFVSEVILTNLQAENPVLFVSSLIFLSNFPIKFVNRFSEQFLPALFGIISQSAEQLLPCYFACCAVGHLLANLSLSEDANPLSIIGQSPEGLTQAIQNTFLTSDQISNQKIASAVSSIVLFFSNADNNLFGQFTEQAVATLTALLLKYMNEESEEARMYSTSIISKAICSLCSSLSNPEVIDHVLGQVDIMIDNQLNFNYLEEILPLIDGCVIGSQLPTQSILTIPSKLVQLIINEGGIEEALYLSHINKRFAFKFLPILAEAHFEDLSSLFIVPVTQMLEPLTEDVEMADETEIQAICTFCQTLFIYINQFLTSKQIALPMDLNQLIPEYLPNLINVFSPFATDAICAMIQFNPILTMGDESTRECIYEKWMTTSHPKAFISSAVSVLENIQNLGMSALSAQIVEHVKVQFHLLNSEEYENCENDEFFDMKSITSFLSKL